MLTIFKTESSSAAIAVKIYSSSVCSACFRKLYIHHEDCTLYVCMMVMMMMIFSKMYPFVLISVVFRIITIFVQYFGSIFLNKTHDEWMPIHEHSYLILECTKRRLNQLNYPEQESIHLVV